MHSLIIAREGNENDSDNQSLIKNATELVDDTHHLLSEQISSVSDELDSFFGEERMDGDFNKSKIRLNFITTFDDEGKATYKTNNFCFPDSSKNPEENESDCRRRKGKSYR